MKTLILTSLLFVVGLTSCTNTNASDSSNPNSSNESSFFGSIFSEDVSFEEVRDPREGAFTVNLPKGWQNQVSCTRTGNQTRNHGVSVSPDGRTKLFFGDPRLPYYSMPVPEYGMHEGAQTGDPMFQIARPVPAQKYFSNYINRKYGNTSGLQITGVNPNQEVKSNWEKEMQKLGAQGRVEAIDLHFQFMDGNKQMKGKIQGVIAIVQQTWFPALNGYITEESDLSTANKCLAELTTSFKINPEWQNKENRMIADRMNRQHQQRMQMRQASFDAHQNRMRNNQNSFNATQNSMRDLSNTYDNANQSWMNNQYSNDRGQENFVDYIRDEQRVSNGDYYTKVESGYDNYYINQNEGTYYGTNNQFEVAPDGYEQWDIDY